MALTFTIGDPARPKGHALLYFRDRDGAGMVATYVLVLPIQMDMGKYLPPLLASQLGSLAAEAMGGPMSSFAAPPMPEPVESLERLEHLASLRGDDLLDGGTLAVADLGSAMQSTAEAVQAYVGLYQERSDLGPQATEAGAPSLPRDERPSGEADVQQVLYELLNERDRLVELSKLVATARFALERSDAALAAEANASMQTLGKLLPKRYWVDRVQAAANDLSDDGTALARLYLERCYKLVDEEYAVVEELERRIAEAEAHRS